MPDVTPITPTESAFDRDLQASQPAVHVSLTRAGVTGVRQVIRISHGSGDEALYYADIECSVDLGAAHKGVHMSRFPELFEEAIEGVVIDEALVVEELAEHIARDDPRPPGRPALPRAHRRPLPRRPARRPSRGSPPRRSTT